MPLFNRPKHEDSAATCRACHDSMPMPTPGITVFCACGRTALRSSATANPLIFDVAIIEDGREVLRFHDPRAEIEHRDQERRRKQREEDERRRRELGDFLYWSNNIRDKKQ